MKVNVISLPYIYQVLCFTRPRYQVSVYMTIGPLVNFYIGIFELRNRKENMGHYANKVFIWKKVTLSLYKIYQRLQ